MSSDDEKIRIGKHHIDIDEFDLLEQYSQYINPFVFQQLFSYACIKGKFECAKVLYNKVYKQFSIVDKIGLRPIFAHYKHIVKDSEMKKWLNEIFQETKNII